MTDDEEAAIWRKFIELRAWEQFNPDDDNPGGAETMLEQAINVLERIEIMDATDELHRELRQQWE